MAIIIGHRGAKGLAPENTLAGLKAGLEAGADMLEIDVRVTRDGVPVLNHNRVLQDEAGHKVSGKAISFHTLAELRQAKSTLPTLEEAIQYVNRRVPLMIEMKPHVDTAPVVRIIRGFLKKQWRPSDFVLASFSQHTLRTLQRAVPEIELAVIERWSGVRASWRCRQLGTQRGTMNQRFLWWFFIRGMQRSGYKLSAYVLNDTAKAARWDKDGLYGVVTDFPDRFRRQSETTKGSPSTKHSR